MSRRRGKCTHHALPPEFRTTTIPSLQDSFADVGLTFTSEKLREAHNFLSAENIRKWVVDEGYDVNVAEKLPEYISVVCDVYLMENWPKLMACLMTGLKIEVKIVDW